MGCGKCGNGTRHSTGAGGGDLRQFAFLTPRQLKLREQQEAARQAEKEKV